MGLLNWKIGPFGRRLHRTKKTREKAPFVCLPVFVASKRKTTRRRRTKGRVPRTRERRPDGDEDRDDDVGRRFGTAARHRERVSIQEAQQRRGGVAVAVAVAWCGVALFEKNDREVCSRATTGIESNATKEWVPSRHRVRGPEESRASSTTNETRDWQHVPKRCENQRIAEPGREIRRRREQHDVSNGRGLRGVNAFFSFNCYAFVSCLCLSLSVCSDKRLLLYV